MHTAFSSIWRRMASSWNNGSMLSKRAGSIPMPNISSSFPRHFLKKCAAISPCSSRIQAISASRWPGTGCSFRLPAHPDVLHPIPRREKGLVDSALGLIFTNGLGVRSLPCRGSKKMVPTPISIFSMTKTNRFLPLVSRRLSS